MIAELLMILWAYVASLVGLALELMRLAMCRQLGWSVVSKECEQYLADQDAAIAAAKAAASAGAGGQAARLVPALLTLHEETIATHALSATTSNVIKRDVLPVMTISRHSSSSSSSSSRRTSCDVVASPAPARDQQQQASLLLAVLAVHVVVAAKMKACSSKSSTQSVKAASVVYCRRSSSSRSSGTASDSEFKAAADRAAVAAVTAAASLSISHNLSLSGSCQWVSTSSRFSSFD